MTKLKEALKRIENLERYNSGLAGESCEQQNEIVGLKNQVARLILQGEGWRGRFLDMKTENNILSTQLKRKQEAYDEMENAANRYAERVIELEKEIKGLHVALSLP
jgi:predicted RNase H-like nuclease (RuvC/YqgF family)